MALFRPSRRQALYWMSEIRRAAGNLVSNMPEPPLKPDVEARNWASACHLLGLAVFFGVPFGNIVGPLIAYLFKKDQDPFVAFAGREALNFQISLSIFWILLLGAYVAAFFGAFISLITGPSKAHPPMFLVAGPFIFALLVLFEVISIVIAAAQTGAGKAYRYPITIRFIR